MFDVGFWELTIIGVVALIIVGPERLPGLARTAGLWIGKARRMVTDVKRDIDRELKASELSGLKEGLDTAHKEVNKAADTIKKASDAEELRSSVKDVVEETAPLKEEIQSDIDEIDEIAKQMENEIDGADDGSGAGPDKADGTDAGSEPAAAGETAAGEKSPEAKTPVE